MGNHIRHEHVQVDHVSGAMRLHKAQRSPHWRLAYRYAPALDPSARDLRPSIPALRWRRHHGPAGQPSAPDEVVDGLWTLLVEELKKEEGSDDD